VNDLGLVEPIDGLGERVVMAVADAAHRRLDTGLRQDLIETYWLPRSL
jgi:hypothetical protein